MKPQLSCKTCWTSSHACLDMVIINHGIYKSIVQSHHGEFDDTVASKVLNIGVLSGAQDLLDQLNAIAVALNQCQNDVTCIADATDTFYLLLHDPVLEPHKNKLLKRFEQVIRPAHLAAYILHPQYQGKHLTAIQSDVARKWITSKSEEFTRAVIQFEAHSAPFPSYFGPSATTVKPLC